VLATELDARLELLETALETADEATELEATDELAAVLDASLATELAKVLVVVGLTSAALTSEPLEATPAPRVKTVVAA